MKIDRAPIENVPDYMLEEAQGGACVLSIAVVLLAFAVGFLFGALIF